MPSISRGILPPLPKMKVMRDTYCSQEVTDKALEHLWRNAPELVQDQMKLEHLNYDQDYLMALSRIIDFFCNSAGHEIEIPTTNLGMQDLLFELSRRLRKICGLPEWEIRGKPLSEGGRMGTCRDYLLCLF